MEKELLNEGNKNKIKDTKDFPITLEFIKSKQEQAKDGDYSKIIAPAYLVYQKEWLANKLKEKGKKYGFNDEKLKSLGLDKEGILDDSVKFDEVILKVASALPKEQGEETVEAEEETEWENNVEQEESDPWMDNIISRVQNNEPIVQKTETPSVMYPDVVDSEPEPEVAPAIPHFEKISHADKDGFTRADDQWIDSKMTLLRKRGII